MLVAPNGVDSSLNTDTNLGTVQQHRLAIDILSTTQHGDNEAKFNEIARTFVSDTVTVPTKEMLAYAALSSLGDDVYHDETTAALESHIARITGKEAALFMPSGTMSNQVAIRSHLTQPPHSVICDLRSHVFKYEAGGMAFHSQASAIPLFPSNTQYLTAADISPELLLDPDVHFAQTKLICLENTLNGIIFPQDEILKIESLAKMHNIKLHLDGARIWHVVAETDISLDVLCAPFDSVSVCFSKGLGAPVGSCLSGSASFITKARAFRKLFGGGMRQTGVLAASAAYALTHHFPLLPRVHALAKRLEQGLLSIGATITAPVDTCMVFYDPAPLGLEYEDILQRAGSLPEPLKLGGSRLVVHIQTTEKAVEDLLQLITTMAEERVKDGFVLAAHEGVYSNGFRPTNIYVRPKTKLCK